MTDATTRKTDGIRRRGALSTFGHGLGLVGLTHAEAAEVLGLSVASVKAYAIGTRTPSKRTMQLLARLWDDIQDAGPSGLPPAAEERRLAIQALNRFWTDGEIP